MLKSIRLKTALNHLLITSFPHLPTELKVKDCRLLGWGEKLGRIGTRL
jgi:hypothetical protein